MKKNQLIDTMQSLIEDLQSNLHTCTIAKVVAVADKTISCVPVINRKINGVSIKLPQFDEVPVMVLQGGGSYTAYPISIGDYCLLFFSERCFDGWWNGNDFVPPLDFRMHSYSDGFAFVGVNPLSQLITIPEKITQVGDVNQEGNYTHIGNMHQEGDFELDGNMTINGNLTVNGDITCTGTATLPNIITETITINGSDFTSHRHTGVTTGTDETGGVV